MNIQKLLSITALCLTAVLFAPSPAFTWDGTSPLVIDHTCEDIAQIPLEWIDSVQAGWPQQYAHTSHGGQLTTGLSRIEASDAVYSYALGYSHLPIEPDAFRIFDGQETNTYITPELYWNTAAGLDYTRGVLDHNPSIRLSMWSWCTQLGYYSEAQVQQYLDAIQLLEMEYPGVLFVYMTGNAQATGSTGYNRYLRNEQIRVFCAATDKVLYDFADLDSWWYNPAAEDWEQATYVYNTATVPVEHPRFNGSESNHTTYESCEQKGRTLWWLMARIAGWQPTTGTGTVPERGSVHLNQNFPNPFSGETAISYYLPRDCGIELTVYDVAGRIVKRLCRGARTRGPHHSAWNGRDEHGARLSSGIYFYRLKSADGTVKTKKMLMLK